MPLLHIHKIQHKFNMPTPSCRAGSNYPQAYLFRGEVEGEAAFGYGGDERFPGGTGFREAFHEHPFLVMHLVVFDDDVAPDVAVEDVVGNALAGVHREDADEPVLFVLQG